MFASIFGALSLGICLTQLIARPKVLDRLRRHTPPVHSFSVHETGEITKSDEVNTTQTDTSETQTHEESI